MTNQHLFLLFNCIGIQKFLYSQQSLQLIFFLEANQLKKLNCNRRNYWYCFDIFNINPLSHMSILGSSNSAANKIMMSKIWTNGEQLSN